MPAPVSQTGGDPLTYNNQPPPPRFPPSAGAIAIPIAESTKQTQEAERRRIAEEIEENRRQAELARGRAEFAAKAAMDIAKSNGRTPANSITNIFHNHFPSPTPPQLPINPSP